MFGCLGCLAKVVYTYLLCSHVGRCTTHCVPFLHAFSPHFHPIFTPFHSFLSFGGGHWIMKMVNHLMSCKFTMPKP